MALVKRTSGTNPLATRNLGPGEVLEKEDDLISETFRSAPAGSDLPPGKTHSPPAGGEFCMANGAYVAQKVAICLGIDPPPGRPTLRVIVWCC